MVIYDNFDPTGCLMSEKLDGVCAEWDGCELTSREGNVFDAPEWFIAGLPSTPLVGELWIDRGRFEDVCSIVRSKGAGDRWSEVRYMIFEGHGFAGALGRFADRVQQFPCESAAELDRFYFATLDRGGEGVVIRDRAGVCHKRKPIEDDDATVIGYKPGAGKYADAVGALIVRDRAGREFRIGTGLSDDDRRQPPQIGRVVTFAYQGRTKNGVPRFASFLGARAEQTLAFA